MAKTTPVYIFPDHNIDPRQKDKKWILDYCRAAWHHNSAGGTSTYLSNVYRMQYISDYAQGKQSVNNYKQQLGVDQRNDETFININYEPLPVLPKFIDIALSRLMKYDYNIIATPIDSKSRFEIDDYFKKQRAKIKVKEKLAEVDPKLAASLETSPDEPKDEEELKIFREYTYKTNLAKEAEMATEAILNDNGFEDARLQTFENALLFGIAGYKEEVGADGRIYIREVNPKQMLIAPSQRKDYKDAEYIAELKYMTVSTLRRIAGDQFTEEQIEKIAKSYLNKFGNPDHFPRSNIYSRSYDDFKIQVMDIEFDSTNMMVYEEGIDSKGNKRYARADMQKASKPKKNGRFIKAPIGVVYRAKWIVGTEYIFDYGLMRNMKRRNSDLKSTSKSYHIRAYSKQGGIVTGKVESMISIVDQINLAWFRLQQAIAEARPDGFAFDLDALEDIPLGKAGQQLTPYQTFQLFLEKGVMPYRSRDLEGDKTHYVPIREIRGGVGDQARQYYEIIFNGLNMIREMFGLSPVSAGEAPERMLTSVAQISDQATSDALAPVARAEKLAFEDMLNGVVDRLRSIARTRPNSPYKYMIGSESMDFFKLSPDLSMRSFAIRLETKPDIREKEMLIQYATKYMDQGLTDMADIAMIRNTDNLKLAEQLLSYRIKKRREEAQQMEMQKAQMNSQGQAQAAQMAEQAKQQTLQLEYQLKMQLARLEKEYDLAIAQGRDRAGLTMAEMQAMTSMDNAQTAAESKEYQTELLAKAGEMREKSKELDDRKRK